MTRNIYTILAELSKSGVTPEELAGTYNVAEYQLKSKMQDAVTLTEHPWLNNFSLRIAQILATHKIYDEETFVKLIETNTPVREPIYGHKIGTAVCMELSLILGRRISYYKTGTDKESLVYFTGANDDIVDMSKKNLKKMLAELMKSDDGIEKIKEFLKENGGIES